MLYAPSAAVVASSGRFRNRTRMPLCAGFTTPDRTAAGMLVATASGVAVGAAGIGVAVGAAGAGVAVAGIDTPPVPGSNAALRSDSVSSPGRASQPLAPGAYWP